MLVSSLIAFVSCLGFCLVFHVRGRNMILASAGGAIGWLVFQLGSSLSSDLVQYFLATVALSVYAEIMARVRKVPVTVFQIVALMPLVPGSGIYRTMEHAIGGRTDAFVETGLHTLAIAASLSIGIILVSSLARLVTAIRGSGNHDVEPQDG